MKTENLDDLVTGENGGADAPLPPEVRVSVKGGKSRSVTVENREALDALAAFGGTGQILVERRGPSTHQGRRVQLGQLAVSLTAEDVRDGLKLHRILGRLGTDFVLSSGKTRVPVRIAGADLSGLAEQDYEEDPTPKPPVIGMDSFGRPVAAPPVYPQPFPMAAPPWGTFAPPISADAIAKGVADALRPLVERKDDAGREKLLLDLEVRKLEWENRRQEREEKERRERQDREERERKDREERDRKDREERERRESARDERDRREKDERDRRWSDEQKELRVERQRQHDLEVKRLEEATRMQLEAVKLQASREEGMLEKYAKLRDVLNPPIDEKDDVERFRDLFGLVREVHRATENPRSMVGEILSLAPGAIRALGEEAARVKATPVAVQVVSSPSTPPVTAQAQLTAASLVSTTNAPSPPAVIYTAATLPAVPREGTLSLEEFLNGLETVRDAIRQGVPAASVVALLRRPLPAGTPNLVAICVQKTPVEMLGEAEALGARPELTESQRETVRRFREVAASAVGQAWLAGFFAEVRR